MILKLKKNSRFNTSILIGALGLVVSQGSLFSESFATSWENPENTSWHNPEQPYTKGLYTEPGWGNEEEANKKTERTFLYWDGHWTEGRSGISPDLPNPKSSDGKSGMDDFRHYRQVLDAIKFQDADPFESQEHGGRDYTPHTVVRVERAITLGKVTLTPGYYQFKIGAYYELPSQHPSLDESLKDYKTQESILIIKKRGMILGYLPIRKKAPHEHIKGESKKHIAFSLWQHTDIDHHFLIIADDGKYDYHIEVEETNRF
ncbi:MAG: hypothetical protein ACKO37_04575 [Vampirovibrionales bacterium]